MSTELRSAAAECRVALASPPDGLTAVHGFDGYRDAVRTMVADRRDESSYEPMTRLSELADRIGDSAAVDASCSVEWVTERTRAGGHTAHLGRAFAALEFDPVLVGTYGRPPAEVFRRELGGAELHSVGAPSRTDAVEFEDGKLMLTETASLRRLDWERLADRVDPEVLARALDGAAAFSAGYWATIPALPSILTGLRETVWPTLDRPPGTVLLDPADVRRLSTDRLREGLSAVRAFDDAAPVVVSANRVEAAAFAGLEGDDPPGSLPELAAAARDRLGVSRVVAHAVDGAALATGSRTIAVPNAPVEDPALTTSAGDHFNAGLLFGGVLGLGARARLLLAVATANYFVRNGEPPSATALASFLDGFVDLVA